MHLSALIYALAALPVALSATGCGIKRDFAGQVHADKSIDSASGGGTRTYDVYLPPTYNENKKTPLIISFHGHGGSRTKQRGLDHFDDNNLNPDHIVIWVEGLKGTDGKSAWQGASYASPGVSDKVFVTDLLAHLREEFCIDDSRIYAVGKSNGGGFVDTLACSPAHGANFAAFAACAGAFYTDNVDGSASCTPARSPLPFLEFHGDKDTTIPFTGGSGSGGTVPNIDHLLDKWGVRNGCSTAYEEKVSFTNNDIVRVSSWQCNGSEVVRGYKVAGMGHHWPSTTENTDNAGATTVIDASPIILDWFRKHSKP